MKHLFNEYYYGRFDDKNFAVYIRRVVKKGKDAGTEKFDVYGYYSQFKQLVTKIKDLYTLEHFESETVNNLIIDLERLEEVIYE